ncbi:extracellular solute-binding protein [Cellulosimicrobium cellulans]|uniref:extracellular solute-binding protein n=1 Tax=Cellulosimicrobium cellulans TaxID=1710 RepID=UPI001963F815|nr:extracellular solute-binding protein [Cellulosimicrobium cellulans]MBN0040911.1 extracellular solute-binding protein [Cellulosimicrobium cellulans]
MKSTRQAIALTLAGALAISTLAACSSSGSGEDDGGSTDGDGKVTLKVVSLLPGSTEEAVAAFEAQVEEFEAANPDIDVVPEEYEWKATTFAAQLAGGTLPDVFEIPFTDAKGLVENGQLADMDEQFRALPYADKFNPTILEAGTGADGNVYAIPAKNAYPVALHYNRALFESAGLDPDQPPTTWDEVREYAKRIADANPGVAGYATMTQNNTGGWQLTAQTVSRGGRTVEVDADQKATATLDNDGTKETLEFLKALRWDDNSMGANFLLDWGSINQEFAAGQVGMFTSGSDIYTSLVQTNAIDPAIYGLAPIPLDDDPDAATLTGGTLAGVPANVDDEVKDAAIKWIDFFYLAKLVDEDRAVADAETLAANDQPVGTPVLPMFSQEQYELNQQWIADYVNVPLDQMSAFTDNMFDLPLVGEPSQKTQEVYALLDPIVQAVLTDENADVDALLEQANTEAQALLDQG